MIDKKIKFFLKIENNTKKFGLKILEKFIKNFKNSININKIKINYKTIISYKVLKKKTTSNKIVYIFILLKKKQTYVNTFIMGKKIMHNTNGIVLKKNSINEKCRKKDSKTSLLNISFSINTIKTSGLVNGGNQIIVNIKKLKPFLNKINKYLKNEFDFKNVKYIISPEIPFFKNKFKKIKSIKRRLRKKYNILDI